MTIRHKTQSLAVALLSGIAAAIEPRSSLEVAEFARQTVVLPPRVGNPPGPWNPDRTPYAIGDWSPLWAYRRYQVIDLIWGAQTSKTILMYLTAVYDTVHNPGPGMIVYPEKTSASRRSRGHVQPILQASIPDYFTGVKDDVQLLEYHLKNCSWYLGWAGSPSVMAGISIKHLKLDEKAKFKGQTQDEADSVNLAMRRIIQFGEFGNCFSATTPTTETAPGWADWSESTQCEYYVPCHKCGHRQTMYFNGEDRKWFVKSGEDWRGGIKWDRDENLTKEQRRQSAYYECEACGDHWTNAQKNEAVRHGEWRAKQPEARRYAAHLPSWYALWVPLSDVVERWWKAYKDEDARHDFLNSDAAVPYEIKGKQTIESDLLKHHTLAGHKKGTFHQDAAVVYLTADVHDSHIRYRLRAWSPDTTSWGIDEGELPPDLRTLDTILARTWRRGDDIIPVAYAIIDARWRTDEVLQWCLAHNGQAYPVMGFETLPGGAIVRYQKVTVVAKPLAGLPLGGELWRVDIAEGRWKDQLFQRFDVHPGDPGAWYLEEGISKDYLFQMSGEIKREKKNKRGQLEVEWVQVHDNHALDVEKYQLVATHVFRLSDIQPVQAPAAQSNETTINPFTGKPIGAY